MVLSPTQEGLLVTMHHPLYQNNNFTNDNKTSQKLFHGFFHKTEFIFSVDSNTGEGKVLWFASVTKTTLYIHKDWIPAVSFVKIKSYSALPCLFSP